MSRSIAIGRFGAWGPTVLPALLLLALASGGLAPDAGHPVDGQVVGAGRGPSPAVVTLGNGFSDAPRDARAAGSEDDTAGAFVSIPAGPEGSSRVPWIASHRVRPDRARSRPAQPRAPPRAPPRPRF